MTSLLRADTELSLAANGRRSALKQIAGAAASTLIPGIALAQGDKITMKVAISLPESHPTPTALKAACADILKESNGRLTIDVYPNSQLGSDTDTVSQVRSGAIDFVCTAGGTIWGNLVPVAAISTIAFAFSDYATVWKAMDGDLGAHIRAGFDKLNLIPVGKFFDHGFRQITTSSKPITSPQDLDGMKLRVPASTILTSLFKGLNASPTTVPIGELYTALQTKVVDGQENALPTIEATKVYEVQKYCSYSSHVWENFILVGNKRSWDKLPKDMQAIVTRVMDEHALKQRAAHEVLNATLEAKLKGFGMQFNAVDGKPFRQMLRQSGYYAEWHKKFGAESWALLEKYSGKLA